MGVETNARQAAAATLRVRDRSSYLDPGMFLILAGQAAACAFSSSSPPAFLVQTGCPETTPDGLSLFGQPEEPSCNRPFTPIAECAMSGGDPRLGPGGRVVCVEEAGDGSNDLSVVVEEARAPSGATSSRVPKSSPFLDSAPLLEHAHALPCAGLERGRACKSSGSRCCKRSSASRRETRSIATPRWALPGRASSCGRSCVGSEPDPTFGWAGENLGDLNVDGAADFIVAAITHAGGGPSAGKVYVYSGRTGSLLHSIAGGAQERMGYAVASAGDANNDGTPDYAIGAPGIFPPNPRGQRGRVQLISGADHSVLWERTGEPEALFGADLNSAGDVNGDGCGDVVVGSPTLAAMGPITGRVYVLSGRDGSVLWTRDGHAPGIAFGTGVSGLGDLDGDGIPEQGVGARNAGNQAGGQAYVLSGRDGTILQTLQPSAGTAVDFGWFFVHSAGDQDGDSTPDIYVGDFNDSQKTPQSSGTGRGYLFSGRTGDRIRTLNAEAAGYGFGVGRGIPDVDGDGRDDLILAAYTSSAGAPGGGRAYVISGRNGKILRRITSAVAGASLGVDAIGLGDVNDDGLADYLLTTFNEAYVVPGTPLH